MNLPEEKLHTAEKSNPIARDRARASGRNPSVDLIFPSNLANFLTLTDSDSNMSDAALRIAISLFSFTPTLHKTVSQTQPK